MSLFFINKESAIGGSIELSKWFIFGSRTESAKSDSGGDNWYWVQILCVVFGMLVLITGVIVR